MTSNTHITTLRSRGMAHRKQIEYLPAYTVIPDLIFFGHILFLFQLFCSMQFYVKCTKRCHCSVSLVALPVMLFLAFRHKKGR